MNWAAMNYVKRLKREAGINGNLRFVMMMIASCVRKGYIETLPTSEVYLAMVTGNDVKTVRRLTGQLIEKDAVRLGEKGRGRGRRPQTFIIPALAGPLFMVPAAEPVKPVNLSENKPVKLSGFSDGKPVNLSKRKPVNLSGFEPENRAFVAEPCTNLYSEDVRTQTTTATEKPTAAVICDETLSFLNWCGQVYAEHRGSQLTINYEKDGPRIEKLLKGPPRRSLARIQAMWLVMLTVTESENSYLAVAPDRGIKLLVYAGDRYDAIVARREGLVKPAAAAPCLYRHVPPCATPTACRRKEQALVAARDVDVGDREELVR